ncbi:MAG: MBL fold metallo-hydrolase [Alphaproteobacteria bacterium]|nr:MBL fold metallo-hydrolase [Alphaproteobacteria bacterium]
MISNVKAFFDSGTNTISYVVSDPETNKCAIIDTVLDYDMSAGRISNDSADEIIAYVGSQGLEAEWVIETHVHADHLSAAPYIKEKLGGKLGIGKNITVVQEVFGKVFNAGTAFERDGSQFDALFEDGDTFTVGNMKASVIHTPGHTPACLTYLIEDATFTGDTIFMPDFGSARCDFPGGSAEELYNSVQRIFELPDDTAIFVCHDYKAPGRDEFAWQTTVGEQKKKNIHVGGGVPVEEFVKMREERDAKLGMPKLILPSIQVNMRGGRLPPAEDDGNQYLKLPVNRL